jgi:hypothetical protein
MASREGMAWRFARTAAADEIDFDIRNPPSSQVTPPYNEPVGVWDNVHKTQSTAKLTAKSHQQAFKISPNSDRRESAIAKPSKSVRSISSKAVQAAIASGTTIPSAADEVAFDIRNPPLTPVTPPSNEPTGIDLNDISPNDVLLGRGGGTYNLVGNQKYRTLVQEFKPIYLLSRRKDKPLIARSVVLIIRNRGGRFLRKDETSTMLYEVGDGKAEVKTSQALREGLDVRMASTHLSETLVTTALDSWKDGGIHCNERIVAMGGLDGYFEKHSHHPHQKLEYEREPDCEGYRPVYSPTPITPPEYQNTHYTPPYKLVRPAYHHIFQVPMTRPVDPTPRLVNTYREWDRSSHEAFTPPVFPRHH